MLMRTWSGMISLSSDPNGLISLVGLLDAPLPKELRKEVN